MKNATKYISMIVLAISPLICYSINTTLAENYSCQQTEDNTKTNNYMLSVKKTKGTYTFQWEENGKTAWYGTGVIHPSITNAISVIFWDPKNIDRYGVELFEIMPDGSLQSIWAMQSAKKVGSETCTKK